MGKSGEREKSMMRKSGERGGHNGNIEGQREASISGSRPGVLVSTAGLSVAPGWLRR